MEIKGEALERGKERWRYIGSERGGKIKIMMFLSIALSIFKSFINFLLNFPSILLLVKQQG